VSAPEDCHPACACPCHGPLDDPGSHLATCAWADPDYDDEDSWDLPPQSSKVPVLPDGEMYEDDIPW